LGKATRRARLVDPWLTARLHHSRVEALGLGRYRPQSTWSEAERGPSPALTAGSPRPPSPAAPPAPTPRTRPGPRPARARTPRTHTTAVSPARTAARVTALRQAVSVTSENAAASAQLKGGSSAGTIARFCSGTSTEAVSVPARCSPSRR